MSIVFNSSAWYYIFVVEGTPPPILYLSDHDRVIDANTQPTTRSILSRLSGSVATNHKPKTEEIENMTNVEVKKKLNELGAEMIRVEIARCTDTFYSYSIDVAGDFDDVITVHYYPLENDQEMNYDFLLKEAKKLKTYLKKHFTVEDKINEYSI